jgi:poly-gamma-glutamate synthesis protein (capsule biosynthesis protein)
MKSVFKNYWKIIIGVLFAIAVLFGLLQRTNEAPSKLGLNNTTQASSTELSDELRLLYNKGNELAKNKQPQTEISFLAAGDIMLSRRIAASISKNKDTSYPLLPIKDLLSSTDFNFANLESPFSSTDSFDAGRTFNFNAPKANVALLTQNNFKVVSTANNHAFDQGKDGIITTINTLNNNSVLPVGTATSTADAWQPKILNIKGVKIAFIAVSYGINAGAGSGNNYLAEIGQDKYLKTAIDQAKQEANFVIVSMHAGTEYTSTPNTQQTTFAHLAIDDGADMVIGAHPHWVQSIEKYNGKYIFYSLGNFVFDQDWSKETSEGLTIKVTLTANFSSNPISANINDLQGTKLPVTIKQIELIPIVISKDLQTKIADSLESKKILDSINQNTNFLY